MSIDYALPSLRLLPALRRSFAAGEHANCSLSYYARLQPNDTALLKLIAKPPATRIAPDGKKVERVPETFLILHNDGEDIIGIASIRHYLTDELERQGGHIGYEIAERHRGFGHGTRLLQRALKLSDDMLALKRVMLTIDDDNAASIRVAEKNGARHWDTITHPYKPGILHRRYWIEIT